MYRYFTNNPQTTSDKRCKRHNIHNIRARFVILFLAFIVIISCTHTSKLKLSDKAKLQSIGAINSIKIYDGVTYLLDASYSKIYKYDDGDFTEVLSLEVDGRIFLQDFAFVGQNTIITDTYDRIFVVNDGVIADTLHIENCGRIVNVGDEYITTDRIVKNNKCNIYTFNNSHNIIKKLEFKNSDNKLIIGGNGYLNLDKNDLILKNKRYDIVNIDKMDRYGVYNTESGLILTQRNDSTFISSMDIADNRCKVRDAKYLGTDLDIMTADIYKDKVVIYNFIDNTILSYNIIN